MGNTAAIYNYLCGSNAAARCEELDLNGKTDWFLPSKDELNLMYQNLYLQGQGNFSTYKYWSSSQYDISNAWCHFFHPNPSQNSSDKDWPWLAVRAIRSF